MRLTYSITTSFPCISWLRVSTRVPYSTAFSFASRASPSPRSLRKNFPFVTATRGGLRHGHGGFPTPLRHSNLELSSSLAAISLLPLRPLLRCMPCGPPPLSPTGTLRGGRAVPAEGRRAPRRRLRWQPRSRRHSPRSGFASAAGAAGTEGPVPTAGAEASRPASLSGKVLGVRGTPPPPPAPRRSHHLSSSCSGNGVSSASPGGGVAMSAGGSEIVEGRALEAAAETEADCRGRRVAPGRGRPGPGGGAVRRSDRH